MKRPKNEAIGECPCPVAGCTLTASVHKFRARQNELQRRLAGKLYLCCAVHGRLGADGAAEMQEIILRGATIWDRPGERAGQGPARNESGAGDKPRASVSEACPNTTSERTQATPEAKPRRIWDIWEID